MDIEQLNHILKDLKKYPKKISKEAIEKAGGNVVCDTCMVVAPIEEMGFEVIGVNSAKAANYVPSMCGLDVVYDDVENLIRFE